MSIKVFQTNKAGKIEFTRCELEKLLNETYKEGYADGEAHAKKDYWTWTSPSLGVTNYPSISYSTSTRAVDDLTCGTTTTNCISNNENAKIAAVAEPKNAIKVEATATNTPKTNAATIEAKSMNFNLDDVNKLASALFGSDLFGTISTNGAKNAVEETPFTKLAKELNF